MINVSIQGCCVLRDVFEFEDLERNVKVDRFIQFINPMTMFGGTPQLSEDIFKAGKLNGVNFAKRCMEIDFKKKLFSYLEEVKSDYILLDISSLVMKYYTFPNGVSFTECRTYLTNEDTVLAALGLTKVEIEKHKKGIFDISVNEIREVMRIYAKKILRMYQPSQIILVELYMAEKYIDIESGQPVQWWRSMVPTHSQNCVLQVAYETLKSELGGKYILLYFRQIHMEKLITNGESISYIIMTNIINIYLVK